MYSNYLWQVSFEVGVTAQNPILIVADNMSNAFLEGVEYAQNEWSDKCWAITAIERKAQCYVGSRGQTESS